MMRKPRRLRDVPNRQLPVISRQLGDNPNMKKQVL